MTSYDLMTTLPTFVYKQKHVEWFCHFTVADRKTKRGSKDMFYQSEEKMWWSIFVIFDIYIWDIFHTVSDSYEHDKIWPQTFIFCYSQLSDHTDVTYMCIDYHITACVIYPFSNYNPWKSQFELSIVERKHYPPGKHTCSGVSPALNCDEYG